MLVYPDNAHAVEPGGVIDQNTLTFRQHRRVRGVRGHGQGLGDTGNGQVLGDEPDQRPPQRPARELRAWFGCLARVLASHMPALMAPVAADPDL